MSEKALIEEYVRYLAKVRNFRPNTVRNHKSGCLKWLKYLGEQNLELCKITEDNLISWIDYRQNCEGVQDATIAKGLCVLRTLYEYLFQFGKMHKNPAECLPDLICRPPAEKSYLTAKECFALLDAFDTNTDLGFRNYILVALMWSTGLRTTELCSLDWRDINLNEGTLLVRSGKGGKQRFLFLNDRIWEDLKKYYERLSGKADAPVFFAFTMNGASTKKWARLSRSQVVEIIRLHAKNVGINKQVNPLTLRHTFATHMYEAGVSIDDLKEMMGHDDTTETTIYIHITLDAARSMLQKHMGNHHE
jgi:site-specific recombinase XerD